MFYKTFRKRKLLSSIIFIVGGGFFAWNFLMNYFYHVSHNDTPCVLFDFDGTLVDSFDLTINCCNQLATEFGFCVITDEQKIQWRHISTMDIVTKHLKIPWYKLPFLQKKATAMMAQHIPNLSLVDGMEEVLKQLKAQGYRLGIISSNSQEGIKSFLKKNNLEIFDAIYGGSSLFGKHNIIKRFLNKFNLHPKNVIYVGDEVRDIQATRKAGIAMVAVDWGLNTREVLQSHNPHAIISHPSELVHALHPLK